MRSGSKASSWSISAVMAVYNPQPELFRQAVSSVLDQAQPVLELVLVNDGGSEAFRELLPDDERIRVFSKPNEGVAATRNFAIRQCRGDYIAFLDQDDRWYVDKLQEQMEMIPAPGEECMVISPVDIVDEHGEVIRKKNRTRVAQGYYRKTLQPDILLALTVGNFIYSSTPVIHRKVFDRVGFFDPYTKPHDDWDMYLRIAAGGVPVYCYRNKPLSVWRVHDANESSKAQAMLVSKCRVEKKLRAVVHDRKLQALINTNLLVDYVGRDNLLYKNGRYRMYRALLRRHLAQLVLDRFNYRGEMSAVYKEVSQRVRKAIMKSARRYVVSYFMRQAMRT